jgi:hypothetical protein
MFALAIAMLAAIAPPAHAQDDAPALDQYVPSVPEPGRDRDLSPAIRLPTDPQPRGEAPRDEAPAPGVENADPTPDEPVIGPGGISAPGLDPPLESTATLPEADDPGLAASVTGSLGGSDEAGPVLVVLALVALSGWAVAVSVARRRER